MYKKHTPYPSLFFLCFFFCHTSCSVHESSDKSPLNSISSLIRVARSWMPSRSTASTATKKTRPKNDTPKGITSFIGSIQSWIPGYASYNALKKKYDQEVAMNAQLQQIIIAIYALQRTEQACKQEYIAMIKQLLQDLKTQTTARRELLARLESLMQ